MPSAIIEVGYQKLHLDLENPRLPEGISKTPKGILTWIARTTAIEDLMNAIATNGFFPGEPLVVYPHPTKAGHYIVIEGNRRLTAVKLLHNPNECEKPTQAILDIAAGAEHLPEELPVVVRQTRREVLPYLGFRHITGIREWDPLAKARYINQLFDATPKRNAPRDRYQEVARSIGSRRDHVKRSLDALAVYDLIQSKDFYEIEGLGEQTIKFAVLSTALADDRIGLFVGCAKAARGGAIEPTDPIVHPNVLHKEAVRDLTEWLFQKDETKKSVVGESRNLRQLGAVVESTKALAALRKGSTLSYAYRLTSGVSSDFIELLYDAQGSLEEAASLVANVDPDEQAVDLTRQLRNLVRTIGSTLKEKQEGSDDDF